jgi:hypothetical protein
MGRIFEPSDPSLNEQQSRTDAEPQTAKPRAADLTGIFKQVSVRETAPLPATAGPGVLKEQEVDLFSTLGQGSSSGDLGFTRMFQSLGANTPAAAPLPASGTPLRQESEPMRAPHSSASEASATAVPPSSGRFDLGLPRANASFGEPSPAPLHGPAGGGFTELLHTLSSESDPGQSMASMPPPAPPMVRPAPEGPGEFTRIISRSIRREDVESEARQEQNVSPPPAPVEPGPPHLPLQGVHFQEPFATSMPGMVVPDSPVQQVRSAADRLSISSATQQGSRGKLQEFVPLLLIAILFALVILILLVAVVLFRHH